MTRYRYIFAIYMLGLPSLATAGWTCDDTAPTRMHQAGCEMLGPTFAAATEGDKVWQGISGLFQPEGALSLGPFYSVEEILSKTSQWLGQFELEHILDSYGVYLGDVTWPAGEMGGLYSVMAHVRDHLPPGQKLLHLYTPGDSEIFLIVDDLSYYRWAGVAVGDGNALVPLLDQKTEFINWNADTLPSGPLSWIDAQGKRRGAPEDQ